MLLTPRNPTSTRPGARRANRHPGIQAQQHRLTQIDRSRLIYRGCGSRSRGDGSLHIARVPAQLPVTGRTGNATEKGTHSESGGRQARRRAHRRSDRSRVRVQLRERGSEIFGSLRRAGSPRSRQRDRCIADASARPLHTREPLSPHTLATSRADFPTTTLNCSTCCRYATSKAARFRRRCQWTPPRRKDTP